MKKLILIVLGVSLLPACAHKTIHEVCSNAEVVSHYANYQQCYAEESVVRQNKEARRRVAIASWNQSFSSPSNDMTCTSNGLGGMNCH